MSAESGYGAPQQPPPGPGPDDSNLSDLAAVAAANSSGMDKRAPRFSWTPAYEATFFRSLCESVQLGLRENHSFKPEAWDRAAAALRDKHGAYPTKAHLVNKSDNARKKFRLWRGLREHPEFLYNPVTKTVTASEDAWKEHIEKEPLSRSLRGRPFDHEDYMEILYPDVIGSGGAPKRIMKPRRKGPDVLASNEDLDTPGPSSSSTTAQHQGQQQQGQQQQAGDGTPMRRGPGRPSAGRPSAAAAAAAAGNNASGGTGSALTPPDDTPGSAQQQQQQQQQQQPHTRKRFAPEVPFQANKTRRNPAGFGTNHYYGPRGGGGVTHSDLGHVLEESLSAIVDTLRASRTNQQRWPEQAVEIFFREFSDEDMDLQLKIAEKALTDENKAMVFVKMPPPVRKHWVSKIREVHNRGGGGVNVGNVSMA